MRRRAISGNRWGRRQTRHAGVDHRARIEQLEDCLRGVLQSYEDTMSLHSATRTERVRAVAPAGVLLDAGDCPSCKTDLEIVKRHAAQLGIETRS